ncbi:MAG: hypothetical protein ACLSAF_06100 [Intestinimonas sp.]
MTITCIVIIIIAALFGLGIAAFLFYVWIDLESTPFCIAGVVTVAVTIAICFRNWLVAATFGERAACAEGPAVRSERRDRADGIGV